MAWVHETHPEGPAAVHFIATGYWPGADIDPDNGAAVAHELDGDDDELSDLAAVLAFAGDNDGEVLA